MLHQPHLKHTIDMRKRSHNLFIQNLGQRYYDQGLDKGEIFEKIILQYSIKQNFNEAVTEWSWFHVFRNDKETFCACSHKKIVIQFLIWNRFNGNILRVGSECISPFIDSTTLGKIKRERDDFSVYRCPLCRESGFPFSTHPVCQECCIYDDPPLEVADIDFESEPAFIPGAVSDSEVESSEDEPATSSTRPQRQCRRTPVISDSSSEEEDIRDDSQLYTPSSSSESDDDELTPPPPRPSRRSYRQTPIIQNLPSSSSERKPSRPTKVIADPSSEEDEFDEFLRKMEDSFESSRPLRSKRDRVFAPIKPPEPKRFRTVKSISWTKCLAEFN